MLDDRKLSARALFDSSSHRQTQLAIQVHTGQTVCYKLPFHVYVSAGTHTNRKLDFETTQHSISSLMFVAFVAVGHGRLHPSH